MRFTRVNNMKAKANCALGFVKRNVLTSATEVRSAAYPALVRPILKYASAALDALPKMLDRIWKLLNIALQDLSLTFDSQIASLSLSRIFGGTPRLDAIDNGATHCLWTTSMATACHPTPSSAQGTIYR